MYSGHLGAARLSGALARLQKPHRQAVKARPIAI